MEIRVGERVLATYRTAGGNAAQDTGTVTAIDVGPEGRALYTVKPDWRRAAVQTAQVEVRGCKW